MLYTVEGLQQQLVRGLEGHFFPLSLPLELANTIENGTMEMFCIECYASEGLCFFAQLDPISVMRKGPQ